jgi:integrase
MPKPLTVKGVEAATPLANRTEVPDGALPGLYLVVQPSGAKSWAVRYRHADRPRKMTLGPYPALGLKDAREAARSAIRIVSDGRDPATERAEREAARPAHLDLVSSVLDIFVARHVKVKNRVTTQKNTIAFIDKEIRPRWKHRDIASITKRDVVELLDEIADRGAPESASRVRAILSKLFSWAIDRDIVPSSPVPKGDAKQGKSRERVLADDELVLVWRASREVGYPFGPMVRLLILTAQRRNEVAAAKRSEFVLTGNDQMWTIPPERSKNAKEHFVPLSAACLAEFEHLPKTSDYLFTTTGKTAVSGFSRAKAILNAKMLEIARKDAIAAGADGETVTVKAWTFHDLRRTAASGMAKLGFPVHVVEAVLNHRSGSIKGVAAIYNRYDYATEKRQALSSWSALLSEIASPMISDQNDVNQGGRG